MASSCVAWVTLRRHHGSRARSRAVLAWHSLGLLAVEWVLGLMRCGLPLLEVPLIAWHVGSHLGLLWCALALPTPISHRSWLRALVRVSLMRTKASLELLACWRWLHAAGVRVGSRARVRLLT